MNALLHLQMSAEGEVVLIGNDEIEVRAYKGILHLAEYFKSRDAFEKGVNHYRFPQYSGEELHTLVAYLCGMTSELSNELIEMIDYFQAPTLGLNLGHSRFEDLSVENIIKLSRDPRFGSYEAERLCAKFLKENCDNDDAVWKIIKLYSDRISAKYFHPLLIKRHLRNGRYEKIDNLLQRTADSQFKYCHGIFSDYFRKADAQLFGNYFAWLLAREKKESESENESDEEEDDK